MAIATYIVIGVLTSVALALLWLFYLLRRSLPRLAGTLRVKGLRAQATITRDSSGVPHISAGTREDGYFALGYVHAQDRLWQMELQRRIASGTLAEIMGKRAIAADRYTRTLDLPHYAAASWTCLDEHIRADIQSYVAGINQYIESTRSHAPEFTLLRLAPRPWICEEVLLLGKLLGWIVCSAHVSELLRFDLEEALGESLTALLLPDFGSAGPRPTQRSVPSPASSIGRARIPATGELGLAAREGQGSNLWIVSGARSASGHAVLANDPHLATSAPSQLYVVHLNAGELHCSGATLPGIPAVMSGRNESIAWGVTNLAPDVQDLYWEKVTADGTHCWRGSTPEPLRIKTHEIAVKGAEPVQFVAKATPRGPLMSEVLQGDSERHRQERGARPPLSLQWTGFHESDRSVEALMRMNAATDWDEFNTALRLHAVPPLNFGFADRAGNIGLHAAGLIPVRGQGDGSVPGDGSDENSGWRGFIPYDELPHSFNPTCGYLVSTNSCAPESDYPHFLGRDWISSARKQRIRSLLEARPKLSVRDHCALQSDTVSPTALQLLAAARRFLREEDEISGRSLALLASWDGDMASSSAAAAIFAAWHLHATRALLQHVMSPKLAKAYQHWTSYSSQFLLDVLTGSARVTLDPAELAAQAFQAGLKELRKRFGADPSRWRWGKMHRAVYPHSPFNYLPVARVFFSRQCSFGGYFDTINIGGVSPAEPYVSRNVAVYRQIIDLGAPADGVFSQCLGQSGHFLSRHYDDFLNVWAGNRYRPLPFATVPCDRRRQMTLLPAAPEATR
jgi:penicillin G amidase